MPSSSTQPTQTTTSTPSPQAQEIMNLALPGVRQFAANVPQRYGSSTVAPFDPNQVAGQNLALGAAGTQGALAGSGAGAESGLLTDIWNPAHNPNLQGAIDASVRPITQNLTQTELPAIRQEAVQTGNFGGSRQGIAEGLASGRASQAIGDTSAKLAQNEYETNINAQLKALGLLPTIQGAQTQPAQTTSAVGDVRQALSQAQLGENVNNFNYDQLAPFLQSKELLSLVQGLPGGTTTSTGNVPQTSPVMSSLGGAASGATLGSLLFPGVGTAAGAGIGALLPFLLNK